MDDFKSQNILLKTTSLLTLFIKVLVSLVEVSLICFKTMEDESFLKFLQGIQHCLLN